MNRKVYEKYRIGYIADKAPCCGAEDAWIESITEIPAQEAVNIATSLLLQGCVVKLIPVKSRKGKKVEA